MWMLQALFGFLIFILAIGAYATVVLGPLALLLFLLRRRLPPLVPRVLLAFTAAGTTAYMLYRMEWFDVWRHGIPSAKYILQTHGPFAIVFGVIGWMGGALIAPRSKTPGAVVRPGSAL